MRPLASRWAANGLYPSQRPGYFGIARECTLDISRARTEPVNELVRTREGRLGDRARG
jgi:hypothetical protein